MVWMPFLRFFGLSVQKCLPAPSVASLPLSAMIPAVNGDATLVPQTPPQLPLRMTATPGEQPDSSDMSESVRLVQPGSCCHEGFATPGLPTSVELAQPAPAPFQMLSVYVEPLFASCVPPTAITLASTDGPPILLYEESPDDARYAFPGVLKKFGKFESPQLKLP